MAKRTTKLQLEQATEKLNLLLKARHIDKKYHVAYRNGYTCLDQVPLDNPFNTIIGSRAVGTKKEILNHVNMLIEVLN